MQQNAAGYTEPEEPRSEGPGLESASETSSQLLPLILTPTAPSHSCHQIYLLPVLGTAFLSDFSIVESLTTNSQHPPWFNATVRRPDSTAR